jgi:hypothetical protein
MSQDKELRGLKDRFNLLVQEVVHVQDENRQLKNRIDFLEHKIDRLLNPRKF